MKRKQCSDKKKRIKFGIQKVNQKRAALKVWYKE